MIDAPVRSVFSEITDFLASSPSPAAIIAYRLPDALQARAQALLDKNNAGTLSEAEQQEMMDFVRFDQMMALLKIKLRAKV